MSALANSRQYHQVNLKTPLGLMTAIADDESLYLLEFVDCRGLEREIERITQTTNLPIIFGSTPILNLIKKELKLYFECGLKEFKTPIKCLGTSFQKLVWIELQKIPYGQTRSYLNIAQAVGKPTACRAAAGANGANQLAIIIPCHRVINSNGKLGGYAGGVARKKWLLNHEMINVSS